jgi:ribosomal protein S18 acetylase RimI-like enzyme
MKIEIATIQDVPEILELQYGAFRPVAESLNWLDAPNLTEIVEHARGKFPKYTTLKMLSDDGKIIGSVRGCIEDGSLYIGRLMVLPEFQKNGYGRILLREIQSILPHNRAWLDTSGDVPETVSFYEREGFRTFESKRFENGVSWMFMEKVNTWA